MNPLTLPLRSMAAAFALFVLILRPAAHIVPAAAAEMHGRAISGPIAVEAAWARASAGMATAGAAFVTIRNTGTGADRLVAVSAPVARRAELHTHMTTDNVMRMRRIDAVPVQPGAATMLRPGGEHVMLMGLHTPLKEGERFPLTLTFEKAGAVTVPVVVRAVAARGHGGMGDGGMGHRRHK